LFKSALHHLKKSTSLPGNRQKSKLKRFSVLPTTFICIEMSYMIYQIYRRYIP